MAQSAAAVTIARSPVGIPFFWETGVEPPVEWPIWAATLKLAIMAKNSINVDSLLKHKPDTKDLTYPIEPTYEPPTENETQAQHRERPPKQQAKGGLGQRLQTDRIQRPNSRWNTVGRSGPESAQPNILKFRNRSPTDISTTIPTLKHRTNNSIRIGT